MMFCVAYGVGIVGCIIFLLWHFRGMEDYAFEGLMIAMLSLIWPAMLILIGMYFLSKKCGIDIIDENNE